MTIVCGWCGHSTGDEDRCTSCGHEDPRRPWIQRGQEPPTWTAREENRRRIEEARKQLERDGQKVTRAALAELLEVDERTLRRWMSA